MLRLLSPATLSGNDERRPVRVCQGTAGNHLAHDLVCPSPADAWIADERGYRACDQGRGQSEATAQCETRRVLAPA